MHGLETSVQQRGVDHERGVSVFNRARQLDLGQHSAILMVCHENGSEPLSILEADHVQGRIEFLGIHLHYGRHLGEPSRVLFSEDVARVHLASGRSRGSGR